MTPIQIVQNDTLPLLEFTIEKNNEPFNLTGCTVTFSMMNQDGTVKISKRACTVVAPLLGTCSCQLLAGDTNEAGQFQGELSVVDSSNNIHTTYDQIPIVIRQQIA